MGSPTVAEAPEITEADEPFEDPPLEGPRTNGWTGGQYSLGRALFGALLTGLFIYLAVWFWTSGALAWAGAMAVGIPLSLMFLVGFWHRTAAAGLIMLTLPFQLTSGHELGPGVMALALVLALHLGVPPNPFGSWTARGSPDPSGNWRMPREVQLAAWLFLSLGYIGQGIALYMFQHEGFALDPTTLNVLVAAHCVFGLLCIPRLLRPFVWLGMLGVQVYLIFPPVDWEFIVLTLPLHLFVFDPEWIRPASLDQQVITFYDGGCGLCHRAVRFVLSEDRTGHASDFACLNGPTFDYMFGDDEELLAQLPDSLLVHREDRTLLVKSSAWLCLMSRLGGIWRVIAWGARLVPTAIRDWLYDFIARRRLRWFRQPDDVCPLIAGRMRARFLDLEG